MEQTTISEAEMLRFIERDSFLAFVYNDLMENGYSSADALRIVYHSDVMIAC